MASQREKAITFRNLHSSGRILVIPNAWDVASARIFEEAGFPAVATTSVGVAVSLGYQDGQNISRDEMLDVVRRIAKSISAPLTADMEAGYGSTPEEVADTASKVILAGAVGMNIEDSTRIEAVPLADIESQVRKITAIREAATGADVPLVINARTDAFRFAPGDRNGRVAETIRRGKAYRDAGADCIFAMGVRDAQSISEVVKGLSCPVNIIAGLETPPIPELERIGVARVTFGAGPKCATLGLLKQIAAELLEKGTYGAMTNMAITNSEMNKLVSRAGR